MSRKERVLTPDEQKIYADRAALKSEIRAIAEEVFEGTDFYKELLGKYNPRQRRMFYDVTSNWAAIGFYERNDVFWLGRRHPAGELEPEKSKQFRRLVRAGVTDIDPDMLNEAGGVLITAKNQAKQLRGETSSYGVVESVIVIDHEIKQMGF